MLGIRAAHVWVVMYKWGQISDSCNHGGRTHVHRLISLDWFLIVKGEVILTQSEGEVDTRDALAWWGRNC